METAEPYGTKEKGPQPASLCVRVPRSKIKSIKFGDSVTVTLTGKVCGMHKTYDDKEVASLDIEYTGFPTVKGNSADASLRSMLGERQEPMVGRHKNEADKSADDILLGKKRAY